MQKILIVRSYFISLLVQKNEKQKEGEKNLQKID